jgi:hypothetical protein
MRVYYGLTNPTQLFEVVEVVCRALGSVGGLASELLLETAAQETNFGQYLDPTPRGAGRGVFQCDFIAFQDVQQRAKAADVKMVSRVFGFDLTRISHECLDLSPLAAAVFARLHYKLVRDAIPQTLDGRAAYWKRFYNTFAGKGTVDKYLASAAVVAEMRVLRGKA